jgi:hypothetical protein
VTRRSLAQIGKTRRAGTAAHRPARWFVRLATLLAALCALAGTASARGTYAGATVHMLAPTTMWTRNWDVRVRATPGGSILSTLDLDQEVRVTGETVGPDGMRWNRVRLWGALDGWIQAQLVAPAPVPHTYVPGVSVSPSPVGPHAPMPLRAKAVTASSAALRNAPSATSPLQRLLPSGTPLSITRWATDRLGRAWYGTSGPAVGWVDADLVNLLPANHTADLAPVRGNGMWCTPAVLESAPPAAIVAAAKRNHITHLYVEVGGGKGGFYGQKSLNALLPLAHRAHIAVLAWVYPYLDNVPRDIAVSLAAARYVTPTGDRPDGLAADVEQNMQEPYVRAFSQILRVHLGPRALMAIATYPPQSFWGRTYPYSTVARSWDVIAPMDYWHVARHAYSGTQAYRYVAASISGIRKATGEPAIPIEVLGQMFDVYGDGQHSPSAAEVRGAIQAAQAGNAVGISFFEWNHATPGEWDALSAASS